MSGSITLGHWFYRNARQRHPNRWSRNTRNWSPITTVRLNPEHGIDN